MVREHQTEREGEPSLGPVLYEDLAEFAGRIHASDAAIALSAGLSQQAFVAASLAASDNAVGIYLDRRLEGLVGFVERLEPPLVWLMGSEDLWRGYTKWLARTAPGLFLGLGYSHLQAQIADEGSLPRVLTIMGFTPTDIPTIYEWRSDSSEQLEP